MSLQDAKGRAVLLSADCEQRPPAVRSRWPMSRAIASFSALVLTSLVISITSFGSIPSFDWYSRLLLEWAPQFQQRPDPFNAATASIVGPVVAQNFPDPSAIRVNGTWYAFATKDINRYDGPNIQLASSPDFLEWTVLESDALPDTGSWAHTQRIWAPDVVQLGDGTFVLYYSAPIASNRRFHCVGAATSASIEGPYQPLSSPFACPLDIGGAIDADGFLDPASGKRYVVYKVDGNSLGHGGACNNGVPPFVPTPIYLQEVADDGVTPVGAPVSLLDRIEEDGPLIEAPSLYVSDEGIYFLFYSSDCFTTPRYDVRYATATNVTGPYVRASEALLSTGDGPHLVGPGGADVARYPGGYMVFHADVGSTDGRIREMYTARLTFEGHNVVL